MSKFKIMKALTLNQKQKEKLLKMCKALFPEYSIKTKLSVCGNILFGNGIDKKSTLKIHWFEFCITHLATILYNKLDSPYRGFSILYYRGMIAQEAKHPIDYLYDEFKKLK